MNRMKIFCASMFLMMVFFLVACTPEGTIDYEAVFLAAQAEVELAPTVNDDFILPTSVEVEDMTVTISWVSSHPNVITITGLVTRPDNETGDVTVTLTATFKLDEEKHEHDFMVVVEALEEVTYTVSFYDGDELLETKVVDAGSKVTPLTELSPDAGYVFGGWFTDETLDEMWDFDLDLVNSNISLYVDWDLMTYTITYMNLNGATHTNPAHFNITTADHILTDATLTGYEFIGWFTALEGGNEVTTLTFDEASNMVLYARFVAHSYTITYVHMDGVENPNPMSYEVTSSNIVFQIPTKENYTFIGWFSNEAMTTPITQITTGSTGNKTIYAKWEAIQFDITYELGDGTMVGSSIDTYTVETPTFDLPSASLEDYAFIGWFDELEGGNLVESVTMGSTGDLTFYARYSPYYDVYYYGQKDYQVQQIKSLDDNDVILTSDGSVLTRGEGSLGLIGNGSFNGQDEFVNITQLFLLEDNEMIIEVDLFGELAIALSSEGRIFIWGYLNFIEEAVYANQPVDITNQFDFSPEEVPTKVASFGTFSLIFTNQGVHRFEHEEAYQLNAPVTDVNFSWGMLFGFGEFGVSLSYRLDEEIFLYDAFLNKNFVNVTEDLNLPTGLTIQAVFSQDSAVHVLMEDTYHFAQFQDNSGVPLSMQVPLTLGLNLEEMVVDVFGGGVILTSEGRLLVPEFVNQDENEIPEMINYSDVTAEFNLNENETITNLFDPMFVMTSEGRFFLIGSNETEEGDELAFHEIDLTLLLQEDEVLLDVLFNMFSLMFKTNLGLYEVGFGEQGLELYLVEASSFGITHHELLVLAEFDPYVYIPEDPMYKTFDGWYLDEELTTLWTYELTTDNMVLYPGFVDTHYTVYLNVFGNYEPYYVPFNEVPDMEDPSIEHYEFLGWYYMDDEDNYVQFMFDKVLKDGTTLDAYMTPIEYQITIIMDLEHIEVIDVMATMMFGNIDFQVFPGYEITGIFTDMDLTIPLNMEATLLSDLTLYVTVAAEKIEVYYYEDLIDASYSTIYAGGNQVFGYLTTGEFVVSGSNYDGALGLGFDNTDQYNFAIDMNEVLNLMPGEMVIDMSQVSARKSLLTSENRVFVWGYYNNIDFNFELINQAKDITDKLNLTEGQSIVKIHTESTGLFIFLNDGSIKYFEFSSEIVTSYETNITFNELILAAGFLNENYAFDNHFVIVTDLGIYVVEKESEESSLIVTDLSYHLAGDELMFKEDNTSGYMIYNMYSKEGRRYVYDLLSQEITQDLDLELNENETLVGIYNISWNQRAIITSDHRMFVLNIYDMMLSEVTMSGFNPGETIIGFYLNSNFVTNEGRLGALNVMTYQISFTAQPLDIGELTVVELVNFGWWYEFRLSDQTIIQLGGNEYTVPFGTNLTVVEYDLNDDFTLPIPEPREGYTFVGWFEFDAEYSYDQTPFERTFLFAQWDEIV